MPTVGQYEYAPGFTWIRPRLATVDYWPLTAGRRSLASDLAGSDLVQATTGLHFAALENGA